MTDNVLEHGTGALNIDECRIEGITSGSGAAMNNDIYGKYNNVEKGKPNKINTQGRWPANVIHDGSDEVVDEFPNTKSGALSKEQQKKGGWSGTKSCYGSANNKVLDNNYQSSEGSAARFFYCPKASKDDREQGLENFGTRKVGDGRKAESDKPHQRGETERRNTHPTVKPTDLMQYLCRLITPKDGVILDPFMGSGSTGKAAMREDFEFIGIDLEKEYCDIADARIQYEIKNKKKDLKGFFK